jgi:hypothetical protein
MLTTWKDNAPRLAPLLQNSFLQEIAPVSDSLTQVATVGLEALDFIASQKSPPEAWAANATKIVTEAKTPKAEVVLTIAEPTQKLIDAAAKP